MMWNMDVIVEVLQPEHWPAVAAIYEAGIETKNATFETAAPTWEVWDGSHRPDLRFVAMLDGEVVGWVAASDVSDRCCYSGVVENSVYVAADRHNGGVGRTLLRALIACTETVGVWTIQTGIFPENTASIALHESCGFRVIGRRERIGQLDGTWRDVLLLERRSSAVG
jgi:L-amino acid N-acyltransferase YncA